MSFGEDAGRRLDLLEAVRARRSAGDFAGLRALLADLPRETLLGEPALGYWLAYALRRVGETRESLALAEELEEPCHRGADRELERRRLNLEAMALFDLGRVEEARVRWTDLLAGSAEAADHAMVAHAANNLGVVATLAGRSEEALAHHARALAAYERLGDDRGIALTHQNLGIAYRERGLPREAETHFRSASRIARPGADADIIARAAEERAVLFLMRGDGPLAEAAAERARRLMAGTADRAGVAECLRVVGLARIVAGRPEDASAPLTEALGIAREVGAALVQAETLEALALLDAERAEDLRDEAEQLFERLGARGWGRSIRARMTSLAGRAGEASE